MTFLPHPAVEHVVLTACPTLRGMLDKLLSPDADADADADVDFDHIQ